MKQERRLLPAGSSLSHIATLVSATSVAQGILLASAPLLTRIYRPADFAVFALFAACMNLMASIGAGRYEFAMMLPKRGRHAAHLFLAALLLSALAAWATLILIVAQHAVRSWTSWLPGAGTWIWLVPLGVVAYCWYGVVAKWHCRQRDFRSIAVAEIVVAVVAVAVQVALGVAARQPGGTHLVLGQVLGRAAGTIVLAIAARRALRRSWADLSPRRMLAVTRRFWTFPVYSGGAIMLGIATHELPKLLLYCIFPPQILGFFALSMRALGAPTALVGKAVGDVFFPRISAVRQDPEHTRRLLKKTSLGLFLLVFPPMLVVFLAAEPLFGVVFGDQWRAAGSYARLLIPLLTIHFVVAPVQQCLQVFEKQLVVFSWQAAYLVMSLLSFTAVWWGGTAERAILCYSIVSTVMYGVLLFLCFHYAGRTAGRPEENHGGRASTEIISGARPCKRPIYG